MVCSQPYENIYLKIMDSVYKIFEQTFFLEIDQFYNGRLWIDRPLPG